ncbi:MAG: valine--tRNA ligase [Spirochaetales bacterium]|nr:valine--tRNA ligase [Spirochaetales bacterium]
MKAVELEKAYNPKDFEDRIYQYWRDGGYFKPKSGNEKPFVIVMPPPNVTGILHMGHALNNQLQDTLIRYYRMNGRPTLWVPGTDHAGIATQNVVERQLAKKGLHRQTIGREAFIEETWKVKEHHHDIIVRQLEKIGCSCDWDRERFTMDEGLSRAVRESFVRLYEKGLIYRGNYLVNYCTHCGTALADDEVDYQLVEGRLYQVAYPFKDGSGEITVATTRPETMFGDVAVAVNPLDERYTALIGKELILPLTNKAIPIIADSYVDMEFGTGMVKITPAHDPNDWEVGKRHDLPTPNILNPDGTLNEEVPVAYRHMDVLTARKAVIADLTANGFLKGSSRHDHDVGHCYRCHTMIEPYVSEQWFVSMRSMADKALQAWKDEHISFYAKRWENTYSHWLENIRDWCISRQLWWGHRIPVWYCKDCGHMMVLRDDPTACTKCSSSNIEQESDVLDTWFSSWLWPFSTLGWPDDTEDLKTFFPTSTLVTGYDIIFFWVSRMIMAALEFLGEVPFKDIYITGLVRDKQGRKMSKSLGNGIDPLDVVDSYGADAMKFTLCYMAAQGQDILVDLESFKLGSRFANKIWNATRFLLMNLEGRNLVTVKQEDYSVFDRWMYHQANQAAAKVTAAIESYRFNDAAQAVYDLFWNDFCDWYVEAVKYMLNRSEDNEKDRIISVTLDLLAYQMKLLHPFLSFITEEIYQKLPNTEGSVIQASYPVWEHSLDSPNDLNKVSLLQDVVKSIRTVRAEMHIAPEKRIRVVLRPDRDFQEASFFFQQKDLIAYFIGASELVIDVSHESEVAKTLPVAGHGFESFVFVRQAIDVEREIEKLQTELHKNIQSLESVRKKLSNEQFLSNAKPEAIEKEHSKKSEFEEKIEKGQRHLKLLQAL